MQESRLFNLATAYFQEPEEEAYAQPGESAQDGRRLYSPYNEEDAAYDSLSDTGHTFGQNIDIDNLLVQFIAAVVSVRVKNSDQIVAHRTELANELHNSDVAILVDQRG